VGSPDIVVRPPKEELKMKKLDPSDSISLAKPIVEKGFS